MRRPPLPASRAGQALIAFWAVILLAALLGAGVLQWLGPPQPRRLDARRTPEPQRMTAHPASPATSRSAAAGVAPPDPALLEPALAQAGLPAGSMLPRIAADGREARTLYAAPEPPVPAGAGRIAILLDGIGLSAADSLDAIDQLPGPVSLAVSPYSLAPDALLRAARRAGHELLLSLPMEPEGAPRNDEGALALTDQALPEQNLQRLQWSLSRIEGYAGVTNAFVGMHGGRFTDTAQFDAVARRLARRGLFYLDADPDQPPTPFVASADVDLKIDDPPDAATIDRSLARLEQIARSKGSAIGVAGPVYPVTIARLAAWAHTLPAHELALVPVSSLVHTQATPAEQARHAPG